MSDEYDNTNSGICGTPFDDQKFILQGKVDVQGNEQRFALISCTNRDGSKRIDVYRKVGAIFPNDKGDNENRPDYTGTIDNDKLASTDEAQYRLAGWRREKDGRKFMTFEVSEKQKPQEVVDETPTEQPSKEEVEDLDDIPF